MIKRKSELEGTDLNVTSELECIEEEAIITKLLPPEERLCSHCKKKKTLNNFSRKSGGNYQSWCKECTNELARQRYQKASSLKRQAVRV